MPKSKDLEKLEKENHNSLKATLALLFLSATSSHQLLLTLPLATRKLTQAIRDLHLPAQALANQHTQDVTEEESEEDTYDPLLTASAALGLVSAVVAGTQLGLEEETFSDALAQSLEGAEGRVSRIATTETFAGYDRQLRANLAGVAGSFTWNATLDRRTCQSCRSLDGRSWTQLEDVPSCPAHVSCRCYLDFDPAEE